MPETVVILQMAATFVLIVVALTLYVLERVPLELTSLGVIAALLLFFHFLPVPGPDGSNLLSTQRLLGGFANPALISVLALLVIGHALVRTGLLDQTAQAIFSFSGRGWVALLLVLVIVVAVSAVLNNIPVVVIFIPIMKALAHHLNRPASALMMPLSFAAILGGMTTLIGSSTNLLVSGELEALGETPFGFFDFTVPGLVLAGVGLAYVLLVAPRLLPARRAQDIAGSEGSGRQFIAQIVVPEGSKLVGERAVAGLFRGLSSMTVRAVQRGSRVYLPPFEDLELAAGDLLIVAATRQALTEVLRSGIGRLGPEEDDPAPRRKPGREVLAEVMVTPASRLIGQTLEQVRNRYASRCNLLGVRRRLRMTRSALTEIRLEAGDVLLVQGSRSRIRALRDDPNLLPMEWSATDLPAPHLAPRAAFVFLLVVVSAASGLVPIVVAALAGATLMVALRILSLGEAVAAIDTRIVTMIAAALALGAALQETGGAALVADAMIEALGDSHPSVVLSAFFLLVAVLSNVISTKACAVLFTPIAVGIGHGLGVDPRAFAVAVVFAANCSFASPVGYQTNLLVMTPGNYRFVDFARAGSPLILLLWAAFSLFAPWYFGLF